MAEGGVPGVSEVENTKLNTSNDSVKDDLSESINELATSYAGYLNLDFSCENQFSETVEDLLTKLDEYIGFADLIRSDVNLALFTTMSSIQTKSREMQKHFDRIDRLEAFMLAVKKNITELESLVEKAESEMGRISSIKKMFSSISLPALFTPKSQLPRSPTTMNPTPTFEPVPIFHTDDYFKNRPPPAVSAAADPGDLQPSGNNMPDDTVPGMTSVELCDSDLRPSDKTDDASLSDGLMEATADLHGASGGTLSTDAERTVDHVNVIDSGTGTAPEQLSSNSAADS